jgi:hypothetical protein
VATQKLAAARLGETLEQDQQSEKLEVIDQPTQPQNPTQSSENCGMAVLARVVAD